MDNLTHSLTGILLSRAGLDRMTPHATWILFLAANAPDIDVVSAFGGSLNYLHYHRHITHSLVMLPVLPLFCVLAVRLLSRQPLNWLGAYCIALIGVASHLILDLTNIYGVRLLLPFSGQWLRLDITGVIDFWIWGALLFAMCAPVLARLVNAEIGAATQAKGGARARICYLRVGVSRTLRQWPVHRSRACRRHSRVTHLLRLRAAPGGGAARLTDPFSLAGTGGDT